MKKTIITLMDLAGVAFGADYTVENVWTVNFGSAYTNGYEATGSITQTWDIVAVEDGTQTSGSQRVHLRDDKFGSWDSDFQFSITLTLGDPISASNNWPVFFELADSGSNKLRVGPYVAAGNTVDMDGNDQHELHHGCARARHGYAEPAGSCWPGCPPPPQVSCSSTG